MVKGSPGIVLVVFTETIVYIINPNNRIARPVQNHAVPNCSGRKIEHIKAREKVGIIRMTIFLSVLLSGTIKQEAFFREIFVN